MPHETGHSFLAALGNGHRHLVFGRRIERLAEALTPLIPEHSSVLDIGCGDGSVAEAIQRRAPTLSFQGLEQTARPACRIPCRTCEGPSLPVENSSFDVCLLVDVLHHTPDIPRLLSEAGRTARRAVIIKDHIAENRFDNAVLQFMDWVGNRPHGVRLLYNYPDRQTWRNFFISSQLQIRSWEEKIPLYPFPFNLVFGRHLHFVALLEPIRKI